MTMHGEHIASSFRPGVWVALVTALLLLGCAPKAYRLGSADRYHVAPELQAATLPQIERGKPRPVLDTAGWIVGIPDKIILWNRRVENHNISEETEAAVADYLAANQLTAVKVRLNQYAPGDEWHRLRMNKSIAWGWRYTFGTFAWLGDTVFPGRLFGGDHYNPYSNTLHIYSDVPAIALHEGGHAKDFSRRNYPGTYAAIYAVVPVAPLYYEAIATRDAFGYLKTFGSADEQREAYSILSPAYGTYVGGSIADFMPGYSLAIQGAAVVGGHVVGRVRAARVHGSAAEPLDTPEPAPENLPAAINEPVGP